LNSKNNRIKYSLKMIIDIFNVSEIGENSLKFRINLPSNLVTVILKILSTTNEFGLLI